VVEDGKEGERLERELRRGAAAGRVEYMRGDAAIERAGRERETQDAKKGTGKTGGGSQLRRREPYMPDAAGTDVVPAVGRET
jgi:hypothetical protein